MFLNIKQVCELTGLGKTTVYALIDRAGFPEGRRITPAAVRWSQSEVVEWMNQRPRTSDRSEVGRGKPIVKASS